MIGAKEPFTYFVITMDPYQKRSATGVHAHTYFFITVLYCNHLPTYSSH